MERDISEAPELIGNPLIDSNMTVDDLLEVYGEIYGFMSGHLYEAIKLIKNMSRPQLSILSFTANLVSTGLRSIFAQMIRKGLFDAVFTTCGTLDHDIARSLGARYMKGTFYADDAELYRQGYHRLGNIFIPIEDYGPLVEKFLMENLEEIAHEKREWGIYELLWRLGSIINDENSIIRAASEARVPIFVPGWPDGAFGTSLFMASQRGIPVNVNYFEDMKTLASIFFTEKKSFGLIVGGGISKHHAIWWSQFMEGLDSVIYVTTAVEYDGSLSGAHPREAISWGKVKAKASKIVVYADATLVLPLIAYTMLKHWAHSR